MSIDPKDFTEMVSQIRRMEKILGSQEKRIHALEKPIREKHGKSIVTSTDIPEGTILTKDMLTFKSPGTGFTPGEIGTLIGRRIVSPIPKDTVLTKEHLAE
jgi:sialic acid synthase SpsE